MAPSLPTVETVTLNTGAAMPLIGLGTAHLYREKGRTALRDALAAGYRHIDCAKGVGRQTQKQRCVYFFLFEYEYSILFNSAPAYKKFTQHSSTLLSQPCLQR